MVDSLSAYIITVNQIMSKKWIYKNGLDLLPSRCMQHFWR